MSNSNLTLQFVLLHDNTIGDGGATYIAEALTQKKDLTVQRSFQRHEESLSPGCVSFGHVDNALKAWARQTGGAIVGASSGFPFINSEHHSQLSSTLSYSTFQLPPMP